MSALFHRVLRIFAGVLDELSDQTAYRRHLATHGTVHSAAEWRRFQDEQWTARSRRARCC